MSTGGHFSSLVAPARAEGERVPVTVLTGFLGSGKTTLLNRLLRQPDLAGTAVIVNEFGSIGIDHDLITHTSDDTVLLANGCLCCSVRGDLIEALDGLANRQGALLRQVLIETSGLADPGPILRVLMGDSGLRRRFTFAGAACTVDAVLGEGTLDRHPEAVRQVAVADMLLLTKTDLLPGHTPQQLLDRLRILNPQADLVAEPAQQPDLLRQLMRSPGKNAGTESSQSVYRPVEPRPEPAAPVRHSDGISSFVLVRDQALPREAFNTWLDMVIAARGEDMLRVKGLVQLAEQPEQPLLVHGVQHLFQPPEFLPAWPSGDRRTRLVFITRGMDAESLGDTLDVLVRSHFQKNRLNQEAK
ncbi:MAG: GTP-binding protein [Pseudomonadota bacterium]